jgi:5-enolpyruvylshikimate-3-phosphate synthase
MVIDAFCSILVQYHLIYIDPNFDITIKVMKSLGISIEEETTQN